MVWDFTNSYCSKETDSSICLIKNKADVNAFNHQGRSPAHFSVQFELYSVLNAVLEAGSSLNKQVRIGKVQTLLNWYLHVSPVCNSLLFIKCLSSFRKLILYLGCWRQHPATQRHCKEKWQSRQYSSESSQNKPAVAEQKRTHAVDVGSYEGPRIVSISL